MQISVSAQAILNNSSNYFVFALYDSTAPTVLLESYQVPKPYVVSFQYAFLYNCLNGHIYNIKLWESADSTPTGVVRNSYSQPANETSNTILTKMPEYLQVGKTTGLASGTSSYVNSDWVGWDYWLVRNGFGVMTPYVAGEDQDYSQDVGGGFTLTQMGDKFAADEKFTANFIPQVIPGAITTGLPSALFSSGRIITANETLTLSDIGKALLLQSSTNRLTVGLPDISTVADYSFFYFYSFGGVHINAVIPAFGSDKFIGNISQIILGQSETLKIFKAFGIWNIENDLPGVNKVGEMVYNDGITPYPVNTLPLAGQLLNRLDYPRLWNWISNNLPSGSVVSDTAWSSTFAIVEGVTYYTKKGFFSSGDGSTTFRMKLVNPNFLRPIDYAGLRAPGSMEIQTLQTHTHPIKRGDSYSGSGESTYLFVGGGQHENPQPGMITDAYGSAETKPTNIGAPLLIRI